MPYKELNPDLKSLNYILLDTVEKVCLLESEANNNVNNVLYGIATLEKIFLKDISFFLDQSFSK